MADPASITTALATIKTAIDIAKAIRSADISLDKAETKLKFAELYELLADAKMNVVEISDVLSEKENQISSLQKAFEFKGKTERIGDAYFEIDNDGLPFGDPYCPACIELGKPAIHLLVGVRCFNCPACKIVLLEHRVREAPHMRFRPQ